MRILTISNCPLKAHQGSGYIIIRFCNGLRARGHHVDLFGPEHVELFPAIRRAKSYRRGAGMLAFVMRKLPTARYDVVEFYGGEACLAATVLALLPRRQFLMVQHSNGLETSVREKLLKSLGSYSLTGDPVKWYQRGLLPTANAFSKVDGLVVLSEPERLYALNHGYQSEARVAVIEPALPDEFLDLAPCPNRESVIGYCGSWIARKGSRVMETEVSEILPQFPDWRFKLIGVGTDFRKDEHFPSGVSSRIEVIPFVEDKRRLRDLYQTIRILIVPSVHESFGLVTAEGMACGCAVVAGKTGFAHCLRDGEEAILIEPEQPGGLRGAIQKLIEDDSLRRRVAKQGRLRVQSLRWPVAIERLERLYQTWLAGSPTRPGVFPPV